MRHKVYKMLEQRSCPDTCHKFDVDLEAGAEGRGSFPFTKVASACQPSMISTSLHTTSMKNNDNTKLLSRPDAHSRPNTNR